jgi:hypothetical protein
MTLRNFWIGLFCILVPMCSFCQKQQAFKRIISFGIAGKVYTTSSFYDTTRQTYLGILRGRQKDEKIYVIREFRKTRAALNWHGHSTIYFFDLKKKCIAFVYLGMPDNLPYKLDHNIFYFKFIEDGITKTYQMKMEIPLPKIFCSRQNGCDEILFK